MRRADDALCLLPAASAATGECRAAFVPQAESGVMEPTLKIFIGFDRKEPVAFAVLAHSILTRASRPVSIVPLVRDSLKREYTRSRGPTEATDFSLTRFLVPYLSNYEGLSLFMDSDMLCLADIGDVLLHVMADPRKALYVCPHDYVPKDLVKFDGHEQTTYPRKNHSSFMVFNNARCVALTPDYVNRATGLELHRFHWTTDDQIGCLPLDWNHLVGEYPPNPQAKVLHFTLGTPAFPGYESCDQADLWWAEYRAMLKPAQSIELAIEAMKGVA